MRFYLHIIRPDMDEDEQAEAQRLVTDAKKRLSEHRSAKRAFTVGSRHWKPTLTLQDRQTMRAAYSGKVTRLPAGEAEGARDAGWKWYQQPSIVKRFRQERKHGAKGNLWPD